MNLNSVFSSVVYKQLVQVDLPGGSHQHEINGVRELREFFETSEPISGSINWHFFSDENDPQQAQGHFTFYDARERSSNRTGRSEWRLYYTGDFINCANPGDIFILARTVNQVIYGLLFQENSGWLRAAQRLFQIERFPDRLQLLPGRNLIEQRLEFSQEQILNELEIEYTSHIDGQINEIATRELERVRGQNKIFPTTSEMSNLAHENVHVDISNADESLVTWLDFEEKLFRAIERYIVQEKLDRGFDSVDDFIDYSLSTQNRRKSRMGYALQNHLHHLFSRYHLRFETQKRTEGKNTPDFLFPSQREYLDQTFNEQLLIMLAAKSSCKERWRQILTEANRINIKHLCTLEQSISRDQTDEMRNQNVQLILPAQMHTFYSANQQTQLWTVDQFISFVREKQSLHD